MMYLDPSTVVGEFLRKPAVFAGRGNLLFLISFRSLSQRIICYDLRLSGRFLTGSSTVKCFYLSHWSVTTTKNPCRVSDRGELHA